MPLFSEVAIHTAAENFNSLRTGKIGIRTPAYVCGSGVVYGGRAFVRQASEKSSSRKLRAKNSLFASCAGPLKPVGSVAVTGLVDAPLDAVNFALQPGPSICGVQ